eukprot:TRINITY_DN24859_c0_g1_i7.p2 TRINITY_DN24859_c0_g1~~TRINITY_DN24859_c0_g1_i7.p2  ORF type:complete len:143 (-),score=9.97 TRINITY_DN24859_c0_g1_i7:292-669(-)
MRQIWINSYTEQIWKAINDGFDVRGLYYWTLIDNFEWQAGFITRFGLYQWEPDGSVDRKLREGSKALQNIYNEIPENYQQLKDWLKQHKFNNGIEEKENFKTQNGTSDKEKLIDKKVQHYEPVFN